MVLVGERADFKLVRPELRSIALKFDGEGTFSIILQTTIKLYRLTPLNL